MTHPKHCPECGTFCGGFGGRPDDTYCHNCGLSLKAKVYTQAEVDQIRDNAYERGFKEADPDRARKVGYEQGYKAGRKAEAADACKHMEVV